MSADPFANWKEKQKNRALHQVQGISYKIQADMSGAIKISGTVKPEGIPIIMEMAKALYQAAIDADTLIQSQNQQAERERISHETDAIELLKKKRLALSVYRRTGSRRLAAKLIPGYGHTGIMFIVANADKSQKKAHLLARNKRMHHLHTQGNSVRTIAKQYGLHHSTVHNIIRRTAKARQPMLF